MAVRDNEAWRPDQEEELIRLVHDDQYRVDRIGDFTTKWPPIAHYLGRTVKSVKRKYDKLFKQQQQQQQQHMGHFDGQGSFGMGVQQYYPMNMMRMGDMPHPYSGGEMAPEDMTAYLQQGGYAHYGPPMYPPDIQGGAYPHMDQQNINNALYQQSEHNKSVPPKNDKVFWKDAELLELIKLGRNETYRQEITGSKELNWQVIADIFGRGKRSVQRKFDNLKSARVGEDGSLILPPNDGKKWSPQEVEELMKIADPDDGSYRHELFGSHKVDWRKFGEYFGRSFEAVAYKFSYERNAGLKFNNPGSQRKHAKAKHETTYKDMAIIAMQRLGGEGTSSQICQFIDEDPLFSPQLDRSIVSGKKTLQRWKHGVRSALNAFRMFEKTGKTFKGEAVWALHVPNDFEREDPAASKEHARAKVKTSQKHLQLADGKLKKRKLDGDESGEEFAREVLTQMAQNKSLQKRKTPRKKSSKEENRTQYPGGNDGSRPVVQHTVDNDTTQLPVNLQQILDSSATAEQLSMLPPEHLAMLQQQIDQGNFAMNMLAYMSPNDGHQVEIVDPNQQVFNEHRQPGYPGYDAQYDQQQQQQHLMDHMAELGRSPDPNGHPMSVVPGMHMNQQHSMHPNGMLHVQPGADYTMYNPYGGYMPYQYPDPSQQHQQYHTEQYAHGNMVGYMPMHHNGQRSPQEQQQYEHQGRHQS